MLDCPQCQKTDAHRKWLKEGPERAEARPIFGTDLNRQLSVIVEEVRSDIYKARCKLEDLSAAFPGWGERVNDTVGLLTCGLVVLAGTVTEMKAHELKYPRQLKE